VANVATLAGTQALRVAAVWGTTVLDLRTLAKGESFEMGDGEKAHFPIPDGVPMSPMPVRASTTGWEIDAHGVMGGTMRLRGRDEDPLAFAKTGAAAPIMPGDYGLLQYGLFSLFFQYTTQPQAITDRLRFELLALLALFSSGVLHVGLLGIVRALMTPPPLSKPIELTNPEEYAARFGLHRATIEPPPPPVAGDGQKAGGSGVKDPGAKDKKPQGGGQKIAGAEGKFGLKGDKDHTEIPGEIQPTTNYGGLSDVLNSDTGEEIKHTLKTIDSVANALSGIRSDNIVLGIGTGTSLKGAGAGGGGTGPGVAFGSGTLATGWGPGNGGGYGSGSGGPGGKGTGGNGLGGSGGGTGRGNGSGSGTGPSESRVVFGNQALASSSGLSPEQVRRVVMAHTGALRACYEAEAQRNPQLRGGVTVAWQIDPGGTVTTASLAGTTLSNARVEGCIVRQVKTWHFPASDAPTTVASYPFRFGVGG
jgi:hypothetical protein